MSYCFSPLTADQLPELNALMRRSKGHWKRGESYLDQFMEAFAIKDVSEGRGYTLHVDGKLVGFYLFGTDTPVWLDYFFIDAPYIGKGYGKSLWDHAVQTAEKLQLTEFIGWSDTGAEAFYQKMGAVTFEKRLAPSTGILAPVMKYTLDYRGIIRRLVTAIEPFDAIERAHQEEVLSWIDSGEPLCRTQRPATPPQHLVSYTLLFDPKEQKLLLVDHKNAQLWLPPGGHVDPGEHPTQTARRELKEELGIEAPLLHPSPLFLTKAETVGRTAGHTDVTLWYLFSADSTKELTHDPSEFSQFRWFALDELPLTRTDPNLERFVGRLLKVLPQKGENRGIFPVAH